MNAESCSTCFSAGVLRGEIMWLIRLKMFLVDYDYRVDSGNKCTSCSTCCSVEELREEIIWLLRLRMLFVD
jgi:hypothetical protein